MSTSTRHRPPACSAFFISIKLSSADTVLLFLEHKKVKACGIQSSCPSSHHCLSTNMQKHTSVFQMQVYKRQNLRPTLQKCFNYTQNQNIHVYCLCFDGWMDFLLRLIKSDTHIVCTLLELREPPGCTHAVQVYVCRRPRITDTHTHTDSPIL